MIDLHFHLLPGIDDGPGTNEEAIALAQAAYDGGTRTLVATPHVSWRYDNGPDAIDALVRDLRDRLAENAVEVEVLAGAELALTRIGDLPREQLSRMTLGDGPWLLVEPPFSASGAGIDTVIGELQSAGHRVLIAHPERCQAFRRDPSSLEALVRGGALTSITAGALVGAFGDEPRRFAFDMLSSGIVHNVASDAHDLDRRPPNLNDCLLAAGLEPLIEWLTLSVPLAITGGEPIPRRPQVDLPDLAQTGAKRARGLRGRFRRAS